MEVANRHFSKDFYDSNNENEIINNLDIEQIKTEDDRLGLGLGLWLTRKLTKKCGGDIKVFSEKGDGSKFVVLIPTETGRIDISPVRERGSVEILDLALNCLVVDDDKYNREININFLKKQGVGKIDEACDGREAVNKFI
mmetsp:Transcript_33244/g.30184  ORF Transcript_33244/g.30184 Transcript_33244/m.30184 type:complete len:140 (+) Transcript_33244:1594-2013(+)